MFYKLLIIFLSLKYSISNNPILVASPYPFNTSESSHLECFTNDQGIIQSLSIIATMLDHNPNNPSLKSNEDNITKNGSIILIISTPFNYSQLQSKIECRSKYHHGEQKINQLEVLSVVEIPQKPFLSINTKTKQMVTIHCRTYGTNVFISWNFSKDISKDIFQSLPIGIRLHHELTINDTLIIDHVSYSDHHGYYQCYATNQLLGIIYYDKSIIYLNVKKNRIWISIIIVCVVIGISILIFILSSKYYRKKRKKEILQEDEEMIEKVKQENNHSLSHTDNSIKSLLSISKTSPQFILNNPFLDPNIQPIISIKHQLK